MTKSKEFSLWFVLCMAITAMFLWLTESTLVPVLGWSFWAVMTFFSLAAAYMMTFITLE